MKGERAGSPAQQTGGGPGKPESSKGPRETCSWLVLKRDSDSCCQALEWPNPPFLTAGDIWLPVRGSAVPRAQGGILTGARVWFTKPKSNSPGTQLFSPADRYSPIQCFSSKRSASFPVRNSGNNILGFPLSLSWIKTFIHSLNIDLRPSHARPGRALWRQR